MLNSNAKMNRLHDYLQENHEQDQHGNMIS